MAMNPAIPQDSPFTPEEIASFGTVEVPEQEQNKTQISDEEIRAIAQASQNDVRREIDNLKWQIQNRPTYTPPPTPEPAAQPLHAGVKFDDKGKAYVPQDEVLPMFDQLLEKRLNDYHNANIAPYAGAVQTVQRQHAIDQALTTVEQLAPDLLQGNDRTKVGRLAIDFFNSPFNEGRDELSRSQWAVNQARELLKGSTSALPISTGAVPTSQIVQTYNQVGRTQAGNTGASNPFGYPPGATIRLKQPTINELGIDGYQAHAAKIDSMYQYNKANNMNWKIVAE